MTQTRIPWARLAAEFVVIVVGVLVALAADDWRERRAERAMERGSLVQVLHDLEIDRDDVEPMVEQTRGTAEVTGWIHDRAVGQSVPSDSLTTLVDSLTRSGFYTYEPSSFAYSGLKNSGRIDLIGDADLKEALVYYFEDRQLALEELNRSWIEHGERWWDRIGPYLQYGRVSPQRRWPPVLGASGDRLARDTGFLTANYELHGWSRDFHPRVVEMLELNAALAAQVRAYLGL